MANDSSVSEVIDELERTIPGAYRSARGLDLDGDAVLAAARGGRSRDIDRETGEVHTEGGEQDPHPDATFRVPGRREFVEPGFVLKGGNPDSDYAPLVDYLPAPTVAAIARATAATYRAKFPHLFPPFNQRVDYLWKRTGGESAGRTILGKCIKVGALAKHYANLVLPEATWVIWIAADNCALITNHQVRALILHELLHTSMNDKLKPKIKGHDVEEFRFVIEEFGFWDDDLRALKASVHQRSLFEDDERQEGSA